MSPVGPLFRQRLRQFPSLVNCSTIDWFHPWPTDALKSVATRFLEKVDLEEKVKATVVDVCCDMQRRVNSLSQEYRQALGRYNYVTPTSYLELIKTFTNLFESTRSHIASHKDRYDTGLRKLAETSAKVVEMKATLEQLGPKLIKSKAETVELMVTIEKKSAEVSATREVVAVEEKECNQQAEAAQQIKDECQVCAR